MVKIIETPRDAFQSIPHFIPSERKAEYIQSLLFCGFDTVEAGSFVSHKTIPQMRDTAEVIRRLDLSRVSSRIMVLSANLKGVQTAVEYDEIDDISYPFSASEVFLRKNIGKSHSEALQEIEQCLSLCENRGKRLIVYLTMAFGNPYEEEWRVDSIMQWAEILFQLGITCIPLSDITGEADGKKIREVFSSLMPRFPGVEFGLHLHSDPVTAIGKVAAAYDAGCRRFDTVLGGYGGCPMTGRELLANLDTRVMTGFLKSKGCEGPVLPEGLLFPIPV